MYVVDVYLIHKFLEYDMLKDLPQGLSEKWREGTVEPGYMRLEVEWVKGSKLMEGQVHV
jgi:hypothetical protein